MKKFYLFLILALYTLVLVLPGYIWFKASANSLSYQLTQNSILGLLFPLFGLYALSFLWIEFTIGAWRRVLNSIFNPTKLLNFHVAEGVFTFLFALLHPFLLGWSLQLSGINFFRFISNSPNQVKPYLLSGILALLLLTLAVLAGLLRKKIFIVRHWKKVHYLNYLVLPLVLFHSWNLGSHVQSTGYISLWYFFTASYVFTVVQVITRRLGDWQTKSNLMIKINPVAQDKI